MRCESLHSTGEITVVFERPRKLVKVGRKQRVGVHVSGNVFGNGPGQPKAIIGGCTTPYAHDMHTHA